MSGSSATVNGRPLWNVATPCRSRFESHAVSQPLLASSGWPSPNGTWHEKLTEKRCRMSNAERPRSAAGSRLFCGKFGSPVLVKNPDASSVDLP